MPVIWFISIKVMQARCQEGPRFWHQHLLLVQVVMSKAVLGEEDAVG